MKELAALNPYFNRYKWRIAAGILFVICANALSTYTPQITGKAVTLISQTLQKAQQTAQTADVINHELGRQVLYLFLSYLGVALVAGVFTFLMRQSIIVVSRLIEYDLKNDIYNHYQKLDLAFYRRNNTGDLMSRITEDVSRVRMYIGPAIMYTVNLLFTIIFSVTYMLMLDKELTMFVLIPLPVLSVIIYFLNERIEKSGTEIQAKLSDLTIDAQETYSGIRVVQAYAREKEMEENFARECEEYKQKQLRMARLDAIYFPVMSLLIGCSIIIVVYVGGMHVGAGKTDPGVLASFFGYVNMLMWPVSSLGWVASLVQRAIASQKRINEFLKQQPAICDAPSAVEKNIQGHIRFSDVSFTYPDTGVKALQHVSFEVKRGQRVAVIGRTGSGKSTIADLLMRMYDVTDGVIEIDGTNIRDIQLKSLRRQIGAVPQDVFLFSESVTENIAFGTKETDEQQVKRFAAYASIGKEIERFPEGYDTMVGERGVTLSGGQKQRISIARALILQPNILVLDDSLSAVDAVTEKTIQKNLDEVLKNKTAVIITHRIFSFIHFDNILVLEDGRIAETGTHNELLSRGGIYASIYKKQMEEQNETRLQESNG